MQYINSTISTSLARLPHLSWLQIAGIASAAVVGIAVSPIWHARTLEWLITLRSSPIRTLVETTALIGSTTSLYIEALGFFPLKALMRDVSWKVHIPARLLVAAISYLSLRRRVNPPPGVLRDMSGKLVVVTGATRGIGRNLVERLAIQGANLVILGRNESLLGELKSHLATLNAEIQVETMVVALEELGAVGKLDISLSNPIFSKGIDALVLNAGSLPEVPAKFGECGYEASITSMHFSHALLAKMCWNLMKDKSRIVITSSMAHTVCDSVDTIFESITSDKAEVLLNVNPDWSVRYGRAKFANALFARQLGRLADEDSRGILVSSHHPGAVYSNIWNGFQLPSSALAILNRYFWATMRTSEEGAATLIDAVAGEEPLYGQNTAPNGSYYISSSVWRGGFQYNKLLNDPNLGRELWNRTDSLIEPFCPKSASWTFIGRP